MGKQVLFPSRPKPTDKQDKRNNYADKQKQKEKKMFIDTIKDMRQMVQRHYGTYNKDTLGMLKTNTKVPYTHLMGRRQKITEKYSHQKARSKQENIQYDSSLQLLNSNIIEQSKRQKDDYLKNKYKFQGENLKEGRLGRQSQGMLRLSKKDIRRINGKQFESKKRDKDQPNKGSKRKRVKKSKKGGNKGKKGGRRH